MAYDSDRILGTLGTYLNVAVSSRLGAINSVQRGTIAAAYNQPTTSATISSVTTSRSVLTNLGGYNSSPIVAEVVGVPIALTNSTTVTATWYFGGGDSSGTVGYQVVEHAS